MADFAPMATYVPKKKAKTAKSMKPGKAKAKAMKAPAKPMKKMPMPRKATTIFDDIM